MEKNNKIKKNNIISLIVLCVSIVALTTSLTYAYFVSQIEEKVEERITITNGTLALTFRDNDERIENIEGTWNFGDTIEKELVIENTGTRDTYAKISWDNLVNTYLAESLTYTLEEKTDENGSMWKKVETESKNVPRSETASTQILADHLSIPAGHTYTYRLRITFEDLEDIDQTPDINANFVTKFTIAESTKPNPLKILIMNSKTNDPIFAEPATTDETAEGLYQMEDDYGVSYYFRGAVGNNYIKFGQNSSGQDMWWRIIRVNGDGSIRMQYDGTGESGTNTYTRGFALKGQPWNTTVNDAKYVGWMFGGAQGTASTSKEQAQRNETDSPIKTAVDEWYKNNIVDTGFGNYVADSIFCNDRNIDSGTGYGNSPTYYGASRWGTLSMNANPSLAPILTCPQNNDKFTVSVENGGNGALTYPVGLITADEVLIAGSGHFGLKNTEYYLSNNVTYWTFTPEGAHGSNSYSLIGTVNTSLGRSNGNFGQNILPVINIKSEYLNQLQGDGTLNSPFYLPNA